VAFWRSMCSAVQPYEPEPIVPPTGLVVGQFC
jgi:hypothetical protein